MLLDAIAPKVINYSNETKLSVLLNALLKDARLDNIFTPGQASWNSIHSLVKTKINEAYRKNSFQSRYDIQLCLFSIYSCYFAEPTSPEAKNQYSTLIVSLRRMIEKAWVSYEENRLVPISTKIDNHNFNDELVNLCTSHRAAKHPIFDFLCTEATNVQFDYFFKSDTALNTQFFDLLAMSLPGSHPETRAEITKNLWDEAGNENSSHNHVDLYKTLLDARNIDYSSTNFSNLYNWQGLTGYNTFMLGASNREHYYKLIGAMAMTELLDPSQYEKLVAGSKRIGIDNKAIYYYSEHIEIDVCHADGWLNRVITPLITLHDNCKKEIYFGAQLRLQTCAEYYDDLLETLKSIK